MPPVPKVAVGDRVSFDLHLFGEVRSVVGVAIEPENSIPGTVTVEYECQLPPIDQLGRAGYARLDEIYLDAYPSDGVHRGEIQLPLEQIQPYQGEQLSLEPKRPKGLGAGDRCYHGSTTNTGRIKQFSPCQQNCLVAFDHGKDVWISTRYCQPLTKNHVRDLGSLEPGMLVKGEDLNGKQFTGKFKNTTPSGMVLLDIGEPKPKLLIGSTLVRVQADLETGDRVAAPTKEPKLTRQKSDRLFPSKPVEVSPVAVYKEQVYYSEVKKGAWRTATTEDIRALKKGDLVSIAGQNWVYAYLRWDTVEAEAVVQFVGYNFRTRIPAAKLQVEGLKQKTAFQAGDRVRVAPIKPTESHNWNQEGTVESAQRINGTVTVKLDSGKLRSFQERELEAIAPLEQNDRKPGKGKAPAAIAQTENFHNSYIAEPTIAAAEILHDTLARLEQEKAQIKSEGDIAPEGCWIETGKVKGRDFRQAWWRSSKPMFTPRRSRGNPEAKVKTSYIGEEGADRHKAAIAARERRERLRQVQRQIELLEKEID
ncbi:hypothetical protein IQ268_09235 [Oculatella sp. LEGE 06141]|uniref:hypothetical protein n=1 Tax=Oculatella sp. LEGE 06141 TaxID=1828648 RepID=UPI001880CEA3|nr:hypothetical protein [Oculatella sp. LEGE 06141]